MKRQSVPFTPRIALTALLMATSACASGRGYDQAEAERYIRESESQWAASVASGDQKVVERILADDFLGVDPDGGTYDKTTMVAMTKDGPKDFVSNHLDEVKIRFYGNAAVAQGSETWERRSGSPLHGRFVWTDT